MALEREDTSESFDTKDTEVTKEHKGEATLLEMLHAGWLSAV
jgi:hypothetical protein